MSAKAHIQRWLAKGMTGCQFASSIARQHNRIVISAFAGLTPEADVTRLFELGMNEHVPAVAITEEHPEDLTTDDVLVGMEWTIRPGLASSPMGLAPFATMPVTRRAPYVCIAAWPGGHENPHWTRYDEHIVHFLDTDLSKLQLSKPRYQSLTASSKDATHELLSEVHDDARHYRRVAFRLQASARESLRGVLAGHRRADTASRVA